MKKILIVCIVALYSCNNKQQEEFKAPTLKYNIGDVVYAKPDSTKIYIWDKDSMIGKYRASYFDKQGKEQIIRLDDLQIY